MNGDSNISYADSLKIREASEYVLGLHAHEIKNIMQTGDWAQGKDRIHRMNEAIGFGEVTEETCAAAALVLAAYAARPCADSDHAAEGDDTMTTDDKRDAYKAAYALCGDFGEKSGHFTQAWGTDRAHHAASDAAALIAHILGTQGLAAAANLLQNFAAGYRHGYDAAAAEYDRELAAHPEDTYTPMTRISGTPGGDGLYIANLPPRD